MPKIDTIPLGAVFGRLTIKEELGRLHGARSILCECACGAETVVLWQNVKKGRTSSCGCLNKQRATTHGESKSRLYGIWTDIKGRCGNPNNAHYSYYGGRGISVSTEWKNSFELFRDWALTNGYAPNLTIERKNVDGDYTPTNCSWENRATQQANRRKVLGTKHRFIGVSQMPNGNWKASVCVQREQRHIGVFKTEDEAVDARDEYIKAHNLPHKLNR